MIVGGKDRGNVDFAFMRLFAHGGEIWFLSAFLRKEGRAGVKGRISGLNILRYRGCR